MGQTRVVLQGGLELMRSHEKTEEKQSWKGERLSSMESKQNWPEKEEAIFSSYPFSRDWAVIGT